VYMSPELINNRNGAKGYDGRHVDVWASGVLLIVMLLGAFPFDHIEHPDPNTSEAHLEVWCAPCSHACMLSRRALSRHACWHVGKKYCRHSACLFSSASSLPECAVCTCTHQPLQIML